MIVTVMGVSGSGKSAVGEALAARLGCGFLEGDSLHSPAAIARMHAGHPLDDADRVPWLDRIAGWIAARVAAGDTAIVACSALRRAYRERLRLAAPDAWFVLLEADQATLRARIDGRQGHFMPAGLLDSQLATLEPLMPDELGMTIDARPPVAAIVAMIAARLGGDPALD